MKTLERVLEVWNIAPGRLQERCPIEIPNTCRDDLATLFHDLGFTKGAEIGVERGAYAEVLCQRNPKLELHCVDAWATYGGYREHVTQSKLDSFYEQTKVRLKPYKVQFVRQMSVEAAKKYADESLDFVYIDANHEFPYVVQDLAAWVPKVRRGGIVSGHDYLLRKTQPGGYMCHVVQAVTGWTHAYEVLPWFVLGTKTQVPGERRDRPRSFMWVKP